MLHAVSLKESAYVRSFRAFSVPHQKDILPHPNSSVLELRFFTNEIVRLERKVAFYKLPFVELGTSELAQSAQTPPKRPEKGPKRPEMFPFGNGDSIVLGCFSNSQELIKSV